MIIRNLVVALLPWLLLLNSQVAHAVFGEVEFKCDLKSHPSGKDCARKVFKELQGADCLPELSFWCAEKESKCRIKAGRCTSPYLWKDAYPMNGQKIPDHLACPATPRAKWVMKKMALALADSLAVERDICKLDLSEEKPPAPPECNANAELSQERIVAPAVAGDKVRFGGEKGPFVIGGDLVMVIPDYKLTDWNSWPYPASVCGRFKKTERGKQATIGVLKSAELGQLTVDPDLLSDPVKRVLKENATRGWPAKEYSRVGEGEGMMSYKLIVKKDAKEKVKIQIALQGDGGDETPQFEMVDGSSGVVVLGDHTGCDVILYLLNNGVVVKAQNEHMCWGNHGYSDPEGVYQ